MHQVRLASSASAASPPGQSTRLSRAFALAALATTFAAAAQADAVGFNPDGAGPTAATTARAGDWLDAHGSGFVIVQPDPASAADYLFVETGAYELTQADGASALGAHDVTLTYQVYGTLNPLTGMATFAGGLVNLYTDSNFNFGTAAAGSPVMFGANDGTRVASFSIVSGGGAVNGTATVQASAIAGSVLPGYFHSMTGTDLAGTNALDLTVNIGNAINPTPSNAIVSEIVCKGASFPGPGCAGGSYANTPYYFVVTDSAQAMLSTSPVPEPNRVALMFAGLGLLGLATIRRRGCRN